MLFDYSVNSASNPGFYFADTDYSNVFCSNSAGSEFECENDLSGERAIQAFMVNETVSRSGNLSISNAAPPPARGAVPEPATWAMMLLGFGMTGFGLRYRRKDEVAAKVAYA